MRKSWNFWFLRMLTGICIGCCGPKSLTGCGIFVDRCLVSLSFSLLILFVQPGGGTGGWGGGACARGARRRQVPLLALSLGHREIPGIPQSPTWKKPPQTLLRTLRTSNFRERQMGVEVQRTGKHALRSLPKSVLGRGPQL